VATRVLVFSQRGALVRVLEAQTAASDLPDSEGHLAHPVFSTLAMLGLTGNAFARARARRDVDPLTRICLSSRRIRALRRNSRRLSSLSRDATEPDLERSRTARSARARIVAGGVTARRLKCFSKPRPCRISIADPWH